LLLGILAAVWWQVEAWTDVVDEEAEEDEGTLRFAFAHLLRARALANAAVALSAILIDAVVGSVIATFIENHQPGASGIEFVAGYLDVVGVGLATCLLASAGIWSAFASGIQSMARLEKLKMLTMTTWRTLANRIRDQRVIIE
jgi:hypothetical protein